MCAKLVICKHYTNMHGQQNIKINALLNHAIIAKITPSPCFTRIVVLLKYWA